MRGPRRDTEWLQISFLILKIEVKVPCFWGVVRRKRGSLRNSLITGPGARSVGSNGDSSDGQQALPALPGTPPQPQRSALLLLPCFTLLALSRDRRLMISLGDQKRSQICSSPALHPGHARCLRQSVPSGGEAPGVSLGRTAVGITQNSREQALSNPGLWLSTSPVPYISERASGNSDTHLNGYLWVWGAGTGIFKLPPCPLPKTATGSQESG